ncbi:FtsB family cell division protein [Pelagibacterium montanilacus]|uniref:FtsB family cell division protein n=1 Tax=Pelagibacterium montanilacus TaxID=2185280 RepID=UPI000F8F149F|nr:septum formation initiator family protein [Pelagibacterium montanilacus]
MPTRVKRPSLVLKLATTAVLVGFQVYLAYHLLHGAYGIESQAEMIAELEILEARQASLAAETQSYEHRIALFDPARLDPDILTERAREMLGLVHARDILITPDAD